MPEGYNGLNFGSFTLPEFTNLFFYHLTESYFHSLAIEDLYSSADPLSSVFQPVGTSSEAFEPVGTSGDVFGFEPVGASDSVFTPVTVTDATFT